MILVFSDIQGVFGRNGDSYSFSYHGSGLRWLGDGFRHVAKLSRDKLGCGIRDMLGKDSAIISSDLPTPLAIDGDLYIRSAAPYSISSEECWTETCGLEAGSAIISSSILCHNPSGPAVVDAVSFISSVRKVAVDLFDGIFLTDRAAVEKRIDDLRLSGKEVIATECGNEIREFLGIR